LRTLLSANIYLHIRRLQAGRHMIALRLPTVSFGTVSAVVTSIGLIIGFGAAGVSKSTIVAGLLIVGLADNLTDSLSIHIYQESEKLEERAAFKATLSNFVTRLLISFSFVLLVIGFSSAITAFASLVWGLGLLTGLTWLVAKSRGANVTTEVLKHLTVAAAVIAASRMVGILISILPDTAV
jgi:VIT1/CCC1 family predicted Fe2+/Mn2+ transporter